MYIIIIIYNKQCLTHPEERTKYLSDPKMKKLLQRLNELENK